ncbi:MraY family glycosyltransferase [Arthrobacter roseus]|uniref:MraY family glycosyltransferase n=1 Tax=Arthrobacter roseus TaxID=136274 RepID=UPI00196699FA|nr:glycosyltransferase family 4 protein [Arthrobacter roseus]MBM7849019.1 UDP-N-acetylmuramyl pentapeptide phosphotransferase/UDP-N-acetylglucosamine-1-phosphate transferase [Arthrobacter roseus]
MIGQVPLFILVLGVTLVASLLLPFALKPVLLRLGVIDIPNERSSHQTHVIRGVGLTVTAAILLGLGIAFLTGLVEVDRSVLLIVALTGLSAALLGWIEDFRGLSIKRRAAFQLLIGVLGALALAWTMDQNLLWVAVGALAIAGYINVANFMDGINGISGLHGVVVGVFYALAGYLDDQMWLTIMGAVIAASFAGFLPWNVGRGFVFLGDVGSYLLGGIIAATATAAFLSGTYVEYLFFPVLIYLVDTFSTLVRRIRAGETWYTSHRQHVYQRLIDSGLNHVGAALLVTACTVVVSGCGFVAATAPPPVSVPLFFLMALILAFYLKSPSILARRRVGAAES